MPIKDVMLNSFENTHATLNPFDDDEPCTNFLGAGPLLNHYAIITGYANGCFGLGFFSVKKDPQIDIDYIEKKLENGMFLNGQIDECELLVTEFSEQYVNEHIASYLQLLRKHGNLKCGAISVEKYFDTDTLYASKTGVYVVPPTDSMVLDVVTQIKKEKAHLSAVSNYGTKSSYYNVNNISPRATRGSTHRMIYKHI